MSEYPFYKQLYIVPDIDNIDESVELAGIMGAAFEYNDFFHPEVLRNPDRIDEIISFYKGLGRDMSRDTMHGAFFDVLVHSSDPDVVAISKRRISTSLDIATRMGLRGVVFHTNFTPNFSSETYIQNWIDKNIECWSEMLTVYPGVDVYIENMFDMQPDALISLAHRLDGMDEAIRSRIGICLDYAHINAFSDNSELWISELAPYIRHIHINDNDKIRDSHDTIGSGQIDWTQFNERILKYDVEASVLIEIRDNQKIRKSYDFLKENGIFPM